MKHLTLLLSFILLSLSTSAQNKSFGFLGGLSTFTQSKSSITAAGGAYVDFGQFGVEFVQSAAFNSNPQDALDYINGKTNLYVSGGKTNNYGIFFKLKPENKTSLYLGVGAQKSNVIKAENITTQTQILTYPKIIFVGGPQPMTTITTTSPRVTIDDNIYMYGTIGVISKLSDFVSFKGGVIVSKTVIATVGVGYNF